MSIQKVPLETFNSFLTIFGLKIIYKSPTDIFIKKMFRAEPSDCGFDQHPTGNFEFVYYKNQTKSLFSCIWVSLSVLLCCRCCFSRVGERGLMGTVRSQNFKTNRFGLPSVQLTNCWPILRTHCHLNVCGCMFVDINLCK